MQRWRLGLGTAGILLGLFGVFRLLTGVAPADLVVLGLWLVGAVAIHDGVLAPVVVGLGAAISRFVPPRARRYLQGFLVTGALVTIIAIPMIHRRGSQPKSKAILQQNYAGHLTLLLSIIAVVSLLAYAQSVVRDHVPRTKNGS